MFLSRRLFSILKPNSIKFHLDLQKKLEHLSLLSFQNEQTIRKVEQTIQASDIIHQANVDHLQPLYTLVETELCPLRQTDTVSNEKTLHKEEVLQNASATYEDYLVAPMIGKRESQTVEKMSSSLSDRLLSTFLNVQRRLETLLNLCRILEKPSWTNDDDSEATYQFCGPYHADIEELENSLRHVSALIENLQHEQETTDDCKPIPDYPLCENGWTLKEIEQLEEEQRCLNLQILHQLSLHTINQLDEDELTQTNDQIKTIPSFSLTDKNLLDLPPELLLHILSFLSPFDLITNVAPTCHYFANLILSRVFSHLDLSKLISVFDVAHLLSYLPSLHSIAFNTWLNETSILTWAIWFDTIAKTTSYLHTISFQNTLLSPILICLIVEYFPQSLRTIVFHYQQNKSYEHFDLILSLLADQNIQLQHITASYQLGITNFGILQLVNNLNVIKELSLLYVEATNDETVKILCDKHHPHIEILKIDGAELTDQALDYIVQCQRLKSIMIEFCTNMTGCNFHLFHNFHHLRELCLSKLPSIPLESFQSLFNENHIFQHLITLKLGECHSIDDACIQSIIRMCPRLIDFTCTWAYSLTDEGFNEIIIRCQHLRRLSLVGCHQISGEILNEVPEKYFQQIAYLNCEHCNQIDDRILVELFKRKNTIMIYNYYGSIVDEDE